MRPLACSPAAGNPGIFLPPGAPPPPRETEKNSHTARAYFVPRRRIAAISPSKPRTRQSNHGRPRLPETLIRSGVVHEFIIPSEGQIKLRNMGHTTGRARNGGGPLTTSARAPYPHPQSEPAAPKDHLPHT